MSERRVTFTNLDNAHDVGPFGSNAAQLYVKDGKFYGQLQGKNAVELADLFSESTGSPTGTIVTYASASAPNGWLECDGSEKSQATYADLYALVADTYGSAASGNFKLPDLRGRSVVGSGTGAGLTARSLAATGGAEEVQLAVGEMPVHTHTFTGTSHGHTFTGSSHGHTFTGDSHGHTFSGAAHAHGMGHGHSMSDHSHSIGNHSHDISDHSHSISDHSHSISDHSHGGIPDSLNVSTSYLNEGSGSSTTVVTGVSISSWGSGSTNSGGSGSTNSDGSGSTNSDGSGSTNSDGPGSTYSAQISPSDFSGSTDSATVSGSINNVTVSGDINDVTSGGDISNYTATGSNASTGGTDSHDNMHPFLALTCIIKI